jgi:hypothetical protein
MTLDLALSAVLMPKETILWSATAEYSFTRKLAPFGAILMGVIVLGISLWTAVENYRRWSATWSVSPEYTEITGIVAGVILGAIIIVGAMSKGAYIPQPEYRLTQSRTIVLAMQRTGHIETTARFIQPDRALRSVEYGRLFELSIPVRRETDDDDAFVHFERLSKASLDSALAVVNRTLGEVSA